MLGGNYWGVRISKLGGDRAERIAQPTLEGFQSELFVS